MKRAGFISYVVPSAVIYHKVSASSSSAIRAYLMTRNRLFWMQTYLSLPIRLKSLPFLVREILWNLVVIIYLKLRRRGIAASANSSALVAGWISYLYGESGKWPQQIDRLNDFLQNGY
jgi:GT2 family glycosyltransferase